MEELQRKVTSRRGHRAHLTKLNNKMEDIMAGELDAVQRATIAIHIEQLEQKRQKLSQLDTEIADLIEKPEDLKEEIPKNYNARLQNKSVKRKQSSRPCKNNSWSSLRNKTHSPPVESSQHNLHSLPWNKPYNPPVQ